MMSFRRFEMAGFKTKELTGINLSVGRVLVMNAQLEPGGATESVAVVARTPVIDTQQVKNVQTITAEVIDQHGHILGCEVWVAKGTYYVYESSVEDTISMGLHVDLYGGFNGDEGDDERKDHRRRWRG